MMMMMMMMMMLMMCAWCTLGYAQLQF